jgi:hypothetical protein
MRLSVITAAAIFGIVTTVLVTSANAPAPRENGELHRAEAARLRAHFDSVLTELHARDVATLQPSQRTARTELVQALVRYRDNGVFPHNHDFVGAHVPYFRDEHGTLCAMAHLVATSGRHDIVEAIAMHRNNASIPQLATDPQLGAWLDSVGLTVAEAARIQPTYNGGNLSLVSEDRSTRRYVLPSVIVGATALTSAVVNLAAPRNKRGGRAVFIGALSGAVSTLLGAALLADETADEKGALVAFDVTVGIAALAAAVQRSARRDLGPESHPPVATRAARVTFDIVPSRYRGRSNPTPVVKVRF